MKACWRPLSSRPCSWSVSVYFANGSFKRTMFTFGKFPDSVGIQPLISVYLLSHLRKSVWSNFSGGIPVPKHMNTVLSATAYLAAAVSRTCCRVGCLNVHSCSICEVQYLQSYHHCKPSVQCSSLQEACRRLKHPYEQPPPTHHGTYHEAPPTGNRHTSAMRVCPTAPHSPSPCVPDHNMGGGGG